MIWWWIIAVYALIGYLYAMAGNSAAERTKIPATPLAFISLFLLWPYFTVTVFLAVRKNRLRMCEECGVYISVPPSKICSGCEAYREHIGEI